MPSTGRTNMFSRRQLLVACGTVASVSAIAGYGYGKIPQDDCTPTPLDTSPVEWSVPNYDGGNTRTAPAESAPPTGLTERWRQSLKFSRPGHPIVTNGSVFIQTNDGDNTRLASYNLFSGTQEWSQLAATGRYGPPLLSGGDNLFLAQWQDGEETISKAVATQSGAERWRTDVTGRRVTLSLQTGHLFIHSGDEIVALDAQRGTICWRESFDEEPRASATAAGGLLIVNVGTDGALAAVDAETGGTRWKQDVSSYFHPNEDAIRDAIREEIVVGEELVFISTYGGRLLALRLESGEIEWVETSSQPDPIERGGGVYGPASLKPVAFTGERLLASEEYTIDEPSVLYALDSTTGEEVWDFETGVENPRQPTVAGETAYVPSADELLVIDCTDGTIIERYSFDEPVEYAIPIGSLCIVTTRQELIALG